MAFKYQHMPPVPVRHTDMRFAPGTYKLGQAVTVTGGLISPLTAAATTTPPYLSMFEGTIPAGAVPGQDCMVGGDLAQVARIDTESVFSVLLGAAAPSLAVGALLQVGTDGLTVNATAAGTFEVSAFDTTTAGSLVQGRFVSVAKDI